MEELWLSWSQLKRELIDKEVVFFGAGEWAEKTLRKIDKEPLCILDNNEMMQDTVYAGVNVVSVETVFEIEEEFIILITTGSYKSVVEQLNSMGFEESEEFYCSPVLYNNKVEEEIKNNDQTLLFSCPEIPQPESDNVGGGLYTFNTRTNNLEKHFSGKLHQIVKTDEFYYVVDEFEGVRVFDKEINLVSTFKGLPGSIMHGLALDEENNKLFIANTGRDSISLMDASDGSHQEEIYISYKNKEGEADRHHINDLCFYKGNLYISMFSFSGLWREGVYDGGVAKFSLEDQEIYNYIMEDMWMPHSIDFINGELILLDSMRGDAYKTSNKKLVNINGFARGIDYDGKYYYIGQSEHRYFDRLKGVSNNISLNCGIHLYDNLTSVSRFYSFEKLTNIHSIVVKD